LLKIGILEGSLRANSLSRGYSKWATGLEVNNMTIEILPSCGNLPLYNQDILDLGIPETVQTLADAINSINGLLIVTPEYNWSIPGVLKNAIDWTSRLKPNPLENLPVTIWTVAPGLLGGARAHEGIRHILHSQNMNILAKPEVQISIANNKIDLVTGQINDQATEDFLRAHLMIFAEYCSRFS
jgi:chromate reductase